MSVSRSAPHRSNGRALLTACCVTAAAAAMPAAELLVGTVDAPAAPDVGVIAAGVRIAGDPLPATVTMAAVGFML